VDGGHPHAHILVLLKESSNIFWNTKIVYFTDWIFLIIILWHISACIVLGDVDNKNVAQCHIHVPCDSRSEFHV
jgi:hypothetical protein